MKRIDMVELYYFSPTGGTYRVARQFCVELAENVKENSLFDMEIAQPQNDMVVVAAPVFGGRIPGIVTERLQQLEGCGKNAIVLAVYGNRAYEDALLELTNVMKERGFQVVAAAALLAQHSIVPAVGAGRPDERDFEEISDFAKKVLAKQEQKAAGVIEVPGNYPYKESKGSSASPIANENCRKCGACVKECPVGAISMVDGQIETDSDKCILCMACVAKCPAVARKLPAPLQEAMVQKLQNFAEIRRENEFFL